MASDHASRRKGVRDTEIGWDKPGSGFSEAVLLGNGLMGQTLCFEEGAVLIGTSHITFFSGRKEEIATGNGSHAEAFRRMRSAAIRGDARGIDEAAEGFIGEKGNYGTHLPAGEVRIRLGDTGRIKSCSRVLDTETGIVHCEAVYENLSVKAIAFCSHPDRVFCLRLECPEECGIGVECSFQSVDEGRDGDILFETQALENTHSDGWCGVKLFGRIRRSFSAGTAGQRVWRFLLSAETDFDGQTPEQCREKLRRTLDAASSLGYDALLCRHSADFSEGMGRARLDLPFDREAQRTFDLGRYLLRSASRADSPCAMSLQGLWNDGVACRIGWTCDMHLNINTQMNYWLCGPSGLEDSRGSLLKWMEERLIPSGRQAAKAFYGLPGWSAETSSNVWGHAAPYWHRSLSPCPACGAWAAEEFAERWRFTGEEGDRVRARNALEGAVEFYLAYLFRDAQGVLHWGPSISPENAFVSGGEKHYAALDMPFEGAVIRGLFRSYLEVCGGEEGEIVQRVREYLGDLPPPSPAPDGTMAEFPAGLKAYDPQHRHLSHLAGLYPYGEITPEGSPEAAAACERAISRRLEPYENWEDTGWARSMLILYEARLLHGDRALFHLREMRDHLTETNGLVMHPPTRGAPSFRQVWELDGNTGAAMGICEMLLQSHGGVIRLLPALPAAWRDGSFEGFCARGGFRVDCTWKNGRITRAYITNTSTQEKTAKVAWKGASVSLCLKACEKRRILPEHQEERA